MKIHELKLDTEYFDDVKSGLKTFEIRKNDRDFKVGDVLALTAFESGHYIKKSSIIRMGNPVYENVIQQEADTIFFDVTYITDYEQKDDYIVMSIVPSRKVSSND